MGLATPVRFAARPSELWPLRTNSFISSMRGPKSLIERLLIFCPEDPLTVSSSLGWRRRVFRTVCLLDQVRWVGDKKACAASGVVTN
jgi:hypothetical protein